MDPSIVAALITAGGALALGLLTIGRQWRLERKKARAAEVDEALDRSEGLFAEYGRLLTEHRKETADAKAELEAERAERRRLREDRDQWRRRAEACERQWEKLIEAKEPPK